MRYLMADHTDVGIKKKTNQDSYMIKEAQTKLGRVFFCGKRRISQCHRDTSDGTMV